MGFIPPGYETRMCKRCGVEFHIPYTDWHLRKPKFCDSCRKVLGKRDTSMDGLMLLLVICLSIVIIGIGGLPWWLPDAPW